MKLPIALSFWYHYTSFQKGQIDLSQYWNPEIYIDNVIGEPKRTSFIHVEYDANGQAYIVERRRVKGTFVETMELWEFPFDVQVRWKFFANVVLFLDVMFFFSWVFFLLLLLFVLFCYVFSFVLFCFVLFLFCSIANAWNLQQNLL